MSQKHTLGAVNTSSKIEKYLGQLWEQHTAHEIQAIIDREAVQPAVIDLLEAAKDFVNKVETGRARSVDSYAKFRAAIAKAEITT